MNADLPASWRDVLAGELEKPYFQQLTRFLEDERRAHRVFPAEEDVFAAFHLTPYEDVRVLLLGQDPSQVQYGHPGSQAEHHVKVVLDDHHGDLRAQ